MYRKKLKLCSANNVTDGGGFAVHRYRAAAEDQLVARVNPQSTVSVGKL